MKKLDKLKAILKDMGSVLVAYSAGTDSTFLLKVAADTLGEKVLAVTATSATYPRKELVFARKMARQLGVKHRIIRTDELKDRNFVANTPQRCYFCKRKLFKALNSVAKKDKLDYVIDATTVSDKSDYRPGTQAKKESGVRSPLQEAGFLKQDVRRLSQLLGLVTWDKPACACLASRVAYGRHISGGILARIDKAERFLQQMGFSQVRLRHYNGLCRIEVPQDEIAKLIKQTGIIVEKLKRLGYNYITLDLEGYRTGSLNEVIKK